MCGTITDTYHQHQINNKLEHRYSQHTDHEPKTCEECGKTFANQLKLGAHKKSHVIIPCQFCGKLIPQTNMKKHLEAKHSATDKTDSYMCEHCPFATTQQRYLYQHKKNGKCLESYVGYACKHCHESFPASKFSEFYYLKHYKSIHNSLPPEFENKEQFLCQACPEIFFSSRNLSLHTLRIHGSGRKALKEYTCKKCNFTCIGARVYASHCLEVHGKVVSKFESIPCKTCDMSFR